MADNEDARSISKGRTLALGVGGLLAAATLKAGAITWISGNPVIAVPQLALSYLLVPGLLVAAMTGSLLVGAVFNGLFYFGFVKLIYWLVTRSRRTTGVARG